MMDNDDDLAGFGEMQMDHGDDIDEVEPLIGSTLNLFKLSGKNMPTETDKYESSVYQTPELNPQLNDSQKINDSVSNEQVMAAIKKLEYDQIQMSTMAKARPGISVSGFIMGGKDSGSEENVPDSNESSFDGDKDGEEEDISEVVKNPFENAD